MPAKVEALYFRFGLDGATLFIACALLAMVAEPPM